MRGLHNLLDDIERGNGQLKISMTDPKAFELGVNIATTPGKVVFQNDLMQLIQYDPATPRVAKRPVLVIPPWINKFYILDLRERVVVTWMVEQGSRVDLVGEPRRTPRRQGISGYMVEGPWRPDGSRGAGRKEGTRSLLPRRHAARGQLDNGQEEGQGNRQRELYRAHRFLESGRARRVHDEGS